MTQAFKIKDIFLGIIVVGGIIFLLPKLFCNECKSAARTNYAPEGYSKTIKEPIHGTVVKTKQEGLLYIIFNDSLEFPFSYDPCKLSNKQKDNIPPDFIQPGDSIFKKQDTDTFYVIRGTNKL